MPVHLRVATVDDVETILPMMLAFNRYESIPWTVERGVPALRRLLSDPNIGLLSLLEPDDGGPPVGYVILTWGFDLEWYGRDAMLTELWVEPSARGGGVGKQAMALAEELAIANGAGAMHLVVRPENVAAQAAYFKAGMKISDRHFFTKKFAPRG